MKTISFDEPINISKSHFKSLEDFQLYILGKLQKSELSDLHRELLDNRILEANEKPENYSTLKELKSNIEKKEISLEKETVALLKIQAEKNGQKIINYMEKVLKEKANEFELTVNYKSMMDNLLEKHNNGELNYISKEDFFKQIKR